MTYKALMTDRTRTRQNWLDIYEHRDQNDTLFRKRQTNRDLKGCLYLGRRYKTEGRLSPSG